MRQWWWRLLLVIICGITFTAAVPTARGAAIAVPTEYQVKAAFLVKFCKYISWPANARGEQPDELVIGVMGATPLWEGLVQYDGTRVANYTIRIRQVSGTNDMTGCRLLFLAVSEKSSLPQLLAYTTSHRIVTVSDIRNFARSGGTIGFIARGNKVHFEINNGVAQSAGVTISSQLLQLAAGVFD
jgi:hypothetical protein